MPDLGAYDVILATLERVWRRHPDMRLGQLVSVAQDMSQPGDRTDVFYIEDDKLERGLQILERQQ